VIGKMLQTLKYIYFLDTKKDLENNKKHHKKGFLEKEPSD
jgi:hypothetical protein